MIPGRSPALARAAAAGTLLAALLIGGIIGNRLGSRPSPMRLRTPGVVGLPMSRDSLVGLLRLQDSQRVMVERILAEGAARSDSLMRTLLNQVRITTSETRDRLNGVLDPEQRRVLDSLLEAQPPTLPRRPG